MTVTQQRKLVTEIPAAVGRTAGEGTRSVARGVGITLPVFVTEAGGGILVDADGNQLIDLGSGIAVVNVGNAALPWFRRAGAGGPVHAHLLHGHAVPGVSRGVRGAEPDHARRPREAVGAAELRRRGS